WSGPEDLSGVARAVWDEEYLYLAVKVTDDAVVQESANEYLHRGDAVELFWDIDLASDFGQDAYSADEAQMVFSPGNFSGKPPFAWVHQSPTGNFHRKMMVGYSFSPEGYQIEMRVPWSGLAIVPESGQIYGYALALSDDDTFGDATQETQMATTPKLPYLHPTHWGNFILD
ncbi:MAG: sugar-binding protein, partial [Ardenticatenaceae bacterium]